MKAFILPSFKAFCLTHKIQITPHYQATLITFSPGWCFRVSNARRIYIKYFNPELVFEALKAGSQTRKAINSQRAAAQRQGYFEHAERLRKGIELYDQWKAEQAETTTNN
ncbi:hypothetical protein [Citrobacter braakii]|uniref:hypothetical protein n=1 Tax=Citrobacter braakii TaxID=57706 RepID=UPI00397659D0